jgi:hypothetical protein
VGLFLARTRKPQIYAWFSDPDGDGWLPQEIKTRLPGREWSTDDRPADLQHLHRRPPRGLDKALPLACRRDSAQSLNIGPAWPVTNQYLFAALTPPKPDDDKIGGWPQCPLGA